MLAKIVFIIAVGLLFSHQFIPHHHHEEISASQHPHDDDGDSQGLPGHSIDHVFSINKTATDAVKIFPPDNSLLAIYSSLIFCPEIFGPAKYHFIEIRPPDCDYYLPVSLRGPPAC